jgi:SIR2-like domain
MILVIFGAGASYDSCPTLPVKGLNSQAIRNQRPERPPLAAELFYNNDIFSQPLRQYWECNPIVPYLRDIPSGSFEEQLDKLQEESRTDPIRIKQLTGIRYYLQDMLFQCENHWSGQTRGITNYLTLMDQLRRASATNGPIILVTFNYDRLLDQALHHFGVHIKGIDDYISNDRIKLFKLHGSINWGKRIESPLFQDIGVRNPNEIAHEIIDKSPVITISDNYVFEDGQYPFTKSNGLPVYPALAIPIINKQSFECPIEHLDQLNRVIGKTKRMLVVGWRGTEKHFRDLIKSNAPGEIEVESVCGTRDYSTEPLNNIQNHGISISGTPYDGGFTEYVKNREAERFFS